jgi:hypothetical protein
MEADGSRWKQMEEVPAVARNVLFVDGHEGAIERKMAFEKKNYHPKCKQWPAAVATADPPRAVRTDAVLRSCGAIARRA